MKYAVHLVLLTLLAGCGSSANLTTTANHVWSFQGNGEAYSNAEIDEQGDRIFLARGEKLILLEANSGNTLYTEQPEKKNRITDALSLSFGTNDQDKSDAVIQNVNRNNRLSESGQYLFYMDVDDNREYLGVRSTESGKKLWETGGYKWSLERYAELGESVAGEITTNIGLRAGMVTSAISKGLLQDPPVSRLMVEVPEAGGILLRSLNEGLVMLDAETGSERWKTDAIEGTGLFLVHYVPSRNELFVAGGAGTGLQELVNRTNFEGNILLNLDAESGEVNWANEYRGIPDLITGLTFYEEKELVMLTFQKGFGELIDRKNGDTLVSTWKNYPGVGQELDQYGTPYTAEPIIDDSMLYAVHNTDLKAVGIPNKVITAYNLGDGSEAWTSDPAENQSDIRDLMLLEDMIVARATGMDQNRITSRNNVVGQAKRRIVAWNRHDGSKAWERITDNGVSRLYRRGGEIVYGDENKIYRLNPASGEVVQEFSLQPDQNGSLVQLLEVSGDLVALTEQTVLFLDTNSGTMENSIAFSGETGTWRMKNGHLALQVSSGLIPKTVGMHLIDLEQQQKLGTINAGAPETAPVGDFNSGYYLPANGRELYLIDESYTLHNYRF
ncbi:MAG: PQQ-binding-like beta-propeller repeat protein [Balneolaceae bacterium]|nr:PQQ-binding-like beta-propeller repeat protein [Balneolaceae bacterium]